MYAKCDDYIKKDYLIDINYFKSLNTGDHICKRIIHALFKENIDLKFRNLKYFLITQYVLPVLTSKKNCTPLMKVF